ncbi:hypothetical protein I316_06712 [Kwoniella heveanensis BCC8398]|uniref:HhH-GPD domain-containing protein n=1 Tax=Kwoniella heveanensis BCC8398 TaxID=1296120 RepID=A0A1B9GLD4_9TREE|nr:hypothetical protein I316_06712 [Kwoniella heveanensis BCC8398]
MPPKSTARGTTTGGKPTTKSVINGRSSRVPTTKSSKSDQERRDINTSAHRSRSGDKRKRKYQEDEENDEDESEDNEGSGSSSGHDDGGDDVYIGSEDDSDLSSLGDDNDDEEDDEDGYEERPAKLRKIASKPDQSGDGGRKTKVEAETKQSTKSKSKSKASSPLPSLSSFDEPKAMDQSKSKSSTKKDKKKDMIAPSTSSSKSNVKPKPKSTAKTGTYSTRTKTHAQITELLTYLLSDKVFDEANPAPKKGYGEVDWAKHTSPANPKTAEVPLPKPGPSKGQKRKAEEKAVPGSLEGDANGNGDENKLNQSSSTGGLIRYPFSPMTPLQTLVASLLLSKPLSHKLGIRTITTLLNPPFSFGDFSTLASATDERRREAMWAARTQHKEKTADQLGELVDGVRGLNGEGEEDGLGGIKRAISSAQNGGQGDGLTKAQAQQRVGDMLKTIKGIGNVGVSIFLRRIQSQWPEVYPYVDERCLASAKYLGILGEDLEGEEAANKLSELLEDDRDRSKLTRLLDTLIGLDLEKKLDDVAERFA